MVHGHPVIDTDKHFVIDPVTRNISNAANAKTSLMQYDHNSERFSFELDREIEGHDMMLCNEVLVQFININSSTREQYKDVYEVKDLQVSELDESKVVFTWLVSDKSTQHPGPLNFLIMFACVENGRTLYRWHTGINNSITITDGMNNSEAVVEAYPDILAQWQEELFNRNYPYEAAVQNGFEGTEEEWNEYLKTTDVWHAKQNSLGWVSEEDIDMMFDGTYEGIEDESPESDYPAIYVEDGTLIIRNEVSGDV